MRKPAQTRSNGDRTKEKILDSAEQEFGAHGFDAVSLRDITVAAEVTLALASYHFGSKENLFEKVVARRASVLCAEREALLAGLNAPDARAIADAFMAPLFAKAQDLGWPAYLQLIARLGESDRWLDLLARHFDPTARLFIDALCAAMPTAHSSDVARAFTLMLKVMLSTASQHGRVDRLTDGRAKAADLGHAYAVALNFVAAGLLAQAR